MLEEPFFVLATENPIEMEGTYPLPEAQLDRFLLKVLVQSPSDADFANILRRTTGAAVATPERVLARDEVLAMRKLCREIPVAEPVLAYAARLVSASDPAGTRASELVRRSVRYGAGVRGGQSLVLAGKAIALLEGRAQVSFDDIRRAAAPVLRHRILRSFEGEADGVTTDRIVSELIQGVDTLPDNVAEAVQAR
jgi:MoxR-like ATPase